MSQVEFFYEGVNFAKIVCLIVLAARPRTIGPRKGCNRLNVLENFPACDAICRTFWVNYSLL